MKKTFPKNQTSRKVSPAIENSTNPPTSHSPTPDSSKVNGNSNGTATSANVKVTIRVRPPNAVELSRGENEIWEVNNNSRKVGLNLDFIEKSRKQTAEYHFDEVFSGSDNKALFENGTVESAAKGSLPSRPNRYSTPGMAKLSGSVYSSVLNLIDLAGSEKATTSVDRRKEGSYINKRLLTRILQNSLSGNARVAVICTISPSIINLEESHNTLKFASRVKKVVTKAHTNEVLDDKALIQKYRIEIEELKAKLERTNVSDYQEKEQELSKRLQIVKAKHEEEMLEAQLIRTALKERIDHLTKLILTNTSFNGGGGAPSPIPSRKQSDMNAVEMDDEFFEYNIKLEEKDMKIGQLTSELKKKDELIAQLTAQLNNILFNNAKQNENELISKLQEQNEELQVLRDANKRLTNVVEQQQKKLQVLENSQ
ncbi:11532_t:CDS:2 [Acaulospora colombiana]|uniref:11532_t:CDS:1 n=1 Tax=Acaulospora colombiana TaxID=27376 RepID=A0ACA9JWA3_9GLOM|nr:11532_t:CDS:2 [Acaulospora colombiana]